jgi:hypothetical protein
MMTVTEGSCPDTPALSHARGTNDRRHTVEDAILLSVAGHPTAIRATAGRLRPWAA